jgi:hypothetical protein
LRTHFLVDALRQNWFWLAPPQYTTLQYVVFACFVYANLILPNVPNSWKPTWVHKLDKFEALDMIPSDTANASPFDTKEMGRCRKAMWYLGNLEHVTS